MKIERINSYSDPRFRTEILCQHGAFIIDGTFPCEVEITGQETAVVRCASPSFYEPVIEEFRYYAEHISYFYDTCGRLLKAYEPKELFWLNPEDIQPSQFFVDEEKIKAIVSFIHSPSDVILPLVQYHDRYLSLDGHTRLYIAKEKGFTRISGFLTDTEEYIYKFAQEAEKREIFTINDVKPLSHKQYQIEWLQCCRRLLSQ